MRQANCSHLLVKSVLKIRCGRYGVHTVSCEENCRSPKTVPGRKAGYIAEVSWGREKQKTLQLPIWMKLFDKRAPRHNFVFCSTTARHYPFQTYLPHGHCTVSAGCFFSKSF